MKRTRIKICSICRPEDARIAVEGGADAVGLILHPPAKRYVSMEQAREIVGVLPPFVAPVGVFVDADPAHIHDVASAIGLRHIQLHGSETENDIAALSSFVILKAIKVDRSTFEKDLQHWSDIATRQRNLRGLVLETGGGVETGGTGIENDWTTIADALAKAPKETCLPIIVAGGLRPDNVAEVVRRIRPFGVDVSSGVEAALRRKSPEKIRAFIHAVRSLDDSFSI